MRTTISLSDELGQAARRRAKEEGLSLSALIARALERLPIEQPTREGRPFRLVTVGGEGPHAGIDLDRSSDLVVADDEGTLGGFKPRR